MRGTSAKIAVCVPQRRPPPPPCYSQHDCRSQERPPLAPSGHLPRHPCRAVAAKFRFDAASARRAGFASASVRTQQRLRQRENTAEAAACCSCSRLRPSLQPPVSLAFREPPTAGWPPAAAPLPSSSRRPSPWGTHRRDGAFLAYRAPSISLPPHRPSSPRRSAPPPSAAPGDRERRRPRRARRDGPHRQLLLLLDSGRAHRQPPIFPLAPTLGLRINTAGAATRATDGHASPRSFPWPRP